MAGIYFHIPFCKQACHYCNFFFTTSLKNLNQTTPALIKELELRKDYIKGDSISTIYFGGGTPSMLPPGEIQEMIDAVRNLFEVDENAEITLEANPENLTAEYLQTLQQTDVNRFSIGIQSFYGDELTWMNRAHNEDEAWKCLELCQEYGYDNYSLDLIFGVPVSTEERWIKNLEKAIEIRPHHISCYALTIEEGTALNHHVKIGRSPNVVDDDVERQFYLAHDMLEKAGYIHYEISNYALPGHESKHNSSYWKGTRYLGVGPGAHSYDGKSRAWNIAHLPKYLEAIGNEEPAITDEILSMDDQYNELMMTGLRKKEGVDLSAFESTFIDYKTFLEESLKDVPQYYYEIVDNYLRLTRAGLVFADFVGSSLFKVEE